jgi:hypothetical protein
MVTIAAGILARYHRSITMHVRALLVLGVAGCQQLLGLHDLPTDAPMQDGARIDAPHDSAGNAQWLLVQTAASTNGTLAIASSGPSHLIVLAIQTGAAGGVTGVTDNAGGGGNSYVELTQAFSNNTAFPGYGLEIWYATAARAGVTSVTITGSQSMAVLWEVEGVRTTAPVDTGTAVSNQPATMVASGPTITTANAGELVISALITDQAVGGMHAGSPFKLDRTVMGNGFAHLDNADAPAGTYQALWDQPVAGAYCASAAAFLTGP